MSFLAYFFGALTWEKNKKMIKNIYIDLVLKFWDWVNRKYNRLQLEPLRCRAPIILWYKNLTELLLWTQKQLIQYNPNF